MDLEKDSGIFEETDSAPIGRVYPYFSKNFNIIAALLARAKRRVLKEFLRRNCALEKRFCLRLLNHLSTFNSRQAAEMILRDVLTEEVVDTFLNELWPFLDTQLGNKMKGACFGNYKPTISEYMYQVIENRPKRERRSILDALSDERIRDCDRDTIKTVLSTWILQKQRELSYYIDFDESESVDFQAEKDLDKFIKDTLNLELIHIPQDIQYCLQKHLNAVDKKQLIQKIWNDLIEIDQPHNRDLISSLKVWLIHRQKQRMIKHSLENGIYVWQEIVSLIQSTLANVPTFFQTCPCKKENQINWADFSQRWMSFPEAMWNNRHPQLPHEMAIEGLYLVKIHPEIPSEDMVACYSCAVHLNRWERDDDPALEHLWFGKRDCKVFREKYTDEFIGFIKHLKFTKGSKPKNLKAAHKLFEERYDINDLLDHP